MDSVAEETVDAQRMLWDIGLNETLRFGKGARRRLVNEESVDRSVVGALV